MRKKYYRRKHGFKKKPVLLKIRPGADKKLKSVFASIGVPEKKPFTPDPFQIEALSAIQKSDCLVTAPTGAGKTWIAEKATEKILEKGGKIWYATPLKALSNAIYLSFSEIFGKDRTGILTGDRKENPDAPVIIGTTEILRNQLYDAMHHGEDLDADFVVLDEAHFLGDEDRGVVWEEIMIYLPSRIPMLMLSATIGNSGHIAKWLSSIRGKECITVNETKRPVPLYPLFFHPSGTLYPVFSRLGKSKKNIIYKKVVSYMQNKHAPRLAAPRKLPPMGDIIRVLKKYKLLPAIFFLKSRADCDSTLDLCTEENLLNNPEKKERLRNRIAELVTQNPHISKHKQLWHMEHLAVGSHHSGQLPAWKLMVETLMKEGLLDAVFATSTVAAGVNFPARTVVLINSDRYNGAEFVPLNATEFHQMTGRCGRRGMDNIGFAVTLPGKFMDMRLISKLMTAQPAEVQSQIKINFSMVLNLLLSHSPQQIEDLLEKSFASYLLEKTSVKKKQHKFFQDDRRYLWRDFQQHLSFLKKHRYVSENNELTDDGTWASRLRIDQPLMVGEGFRLGIFPESDPAMLAAIIAAFVNEKESDDEKVSREMIPKNLLTVYLNIKKQLHPFAQEMISEGFSVRPLYLNPVATIYAWADGKPWENVLMISGLAEGDLARLVMRTADNLRHIKNLTKVFPKVAEASLTAIDLIMREPVIEIYE